MSSPSGRAAFTPDIITVGGAMVDTYASSTLFEMERSASAPAAWNACVPLGAKIPLSDLCLNTGGGATNAAVTFARLGLRTAALCRVGADLYGAYVKQQLREEGVDIRLVQEDADRPTGQSIVLVSGIGERSVLVHRGASAELDPKHVPWNHLRPRWFYATSLDGDLGFLSLLLHHAERIGARIAWNPGTAELEKGLTRLRPFIKRVDIFDVNREEAALLTHKPARHLGDILRVLDGLPKTALLLSDGQQGAYVASRGCAWHAPGCPGKRVNTTGAGDAFGSGFVAGFSQTCDIVLAFRLGMLNAFSVVTHMGAKAGILKKWPTEKELARIRLRPATL